MSEWPSVIAQRALTAKIRQELWDTITELLAAQVRVPDQVSEFKLVWLVGMRSVSLQVTPETKDYLVAYGTLVLTMSAKEAAEQIKEWLCTSKKD